MCKRYGNINITSTRRKGLHFITKTKNNMKKIVRTNFEKYLLAQRAIVESVI